MCDKIGEEVKVEGEMWWWLWFYDLGVGDVFYMFIEGSKVIVLIFLIFLLILLLM